MIRKGEIKMKNQRFYFVVILLLVAAVLAVFGQEAQAGEGLTKIADNVYSYVDIRQGSPQNSYGANAGIIIGKDGIVVVDTLISAKKARQFIKDIRAISDKPVRYVINTHYHLDHALGNSEFVKLGAVIISHENDKKNLEKSGEATLRNYKNYGLTEKDVEGTSIAYPSVTFSDRMEIDLGDQKVELLFIGPSHTSGSILVYLPDKKILFAGDTLFTNYHPFMAEGDLTGWFKTLDYILKMDVDMIIPGHGPISGKKDVGDMKEYLVAFDKYAQQFSAKSQDIEYIFSEMKKVLPARAEADFLIKSNIQMRYLKKQ
jgi:cyclase